MLHQLRQDSLDHEGDFEAGELDGIDDLVGQNERSLFLDGLMGHGGSMMLELSALGWLHVLYGAEFDMLKHTAFETDVEEIMEAVLNSNQEYQ